MELNLAIKIHIINWENLEQQQGTEKKQLNEM